MLGGILFAGEEPSAGQQQGAQACQHTGHPAGGAGLGQDGGADIYELVGTDTAGLLSSLAEEFGALTFRLPRDTIPSLPAMRTGEIMFSMICPLNEDILLENTGAQTTEELALGEYGRVCTLEFC